MTKEETVYFRPDRMEQNERQWIHGIFPTHSHVSETVEEENHEKIRRPDDAGEGAEGRRRGEVIPLLLLLRLPATDR